MKIQIPIVPKNGNTGRGGAFWATAKAREAAECQLRAAGLIADPADQRVDLVFTRVLGKRERLWDADSVLRGNVKEILDAMVACGWFRDDGPKWIRHCDGRQDNTRREDGPFWEIEIVEVNE